MMGSFNKTKNECSTSSEKKEPAVLKSTSSEILPNYDSQIDPERQVQERASEPVSLPLAQKDETRSARNHILKQMRLRNRFLKGRKLPKHYVRIFLNNFKDFIREFTQEEIKVLTKIEKNLKYRLRNDNIQLKALGSFLSESSKVPWALAHKNKRILSTLLRNNMCQCPKIKQKQFYMFASRIYAIRCRNSELLSRNSVI